MMNNANAIAYVTGNQKDHEFEIHRAGCAHLKRLHPWACVTFHELGEGETAVDFVNEEVAEYEYQEQYWQHSDFRIFPCVNS
jgi:hypothetical protein